MIHKYIRLSKDLLLDMFNAKHKDVLGPILTFKYRTEFDGERNNLVIII